MSVIKPIIVVFIVFIVFVLVMIYFSVIIHDTKLIYKNPALFLIETLIAGLFPSLYIFIFYWLRSKKITSTTYYLYFFGSFILILVHLLVQLSGLYSLILTL